MSHGHTKISFIDNIKNSVVLESCVHGMGLWATKDIKKGQRLCILKGQILEASELEMFIDDEIYRDILFIEKCVLNDGRIMILPFRTKYGFINHSDEMSHIKKVYNPKTESIEVYARVDIMKNSEILDTYNLDMHIDVLGGFDDKAINKK